jgi:hypothetical protein
MKIKIYKFIPQMKKYLPIFMLVVLLSSIAVASSHNHKCTENSDNCIACNVQHSFSTMTIEMAAHGAELPRPLTESLVVLNDRVTDPSQKLICSSHAPPQFI